VVKPTYEELADFVLRLQAIDCNEIHPVDCKNCVLLYTGFCKETDNLANLLDED